MGKGGVVGQVFCLGAGIIRITQIDNIRELTFYSACAKLITVR
jgi:hypothetical protein